MEALTLHTSRRVTLRVTLDDQIMVAPMRWILTATCDDCGHTAILHESNYLRDCIRHAFAAWQLLQIHDEHHLCGYVPLDDFVASFGKN